MPQIVQEPGGAEFECAADDTVLRAALRAGIGMPYSCNTGSCGNCRFTLIEGAVRHLRADAPAWSERERKRNRWLGCQAVPRSDCRVKFRTLPEYVPPHRPARRAAALTERREITHDIAEFAFRVDGDPAFAPGQYALFHLPGVEGARAYSMSNLGAEGVWRFMVKRAAAGAATGWLWEAEPGAEATLDGPYGSAYLRPDSPRDIVLLAGGSGLSPMVSIARGAAAAGLLESRKLRLFYGGRRMADLVEAGVCGPKVAGRIVFAAALSEPEAAWTGHRGFLPAVVRAEMGEALAECEVYFAGPAAMGEAVQRMAHEAGVPRDQLHFDEFY